MMDAGFCQFSNLSGLEYSQFADFYNEQEVQTRAKHEKHLVKDYFPLVSISALLSYIHSHNLFLEYVWSTIETKIRAILMQ